MVVKEDHRLLVLVAGKPEAVRALGTRTLSNLAPLLVEGLTKSAADPQVGFRVVQVVRRSFEIRRADLLPVFRRFPVSVSLR